MKSLLLLFCIGSINCLVAPCAEILKKRDADEADMKRCGGGGGGGGGVCRSCSGDQDCPDLSPAPCLNGPYCNWPNTANSQCRATRQDGNTCDKRCSSDSHCQGPCPYCKRITVSNWRCRADTCSMFCTQGGGRECKGRCGTCNWLKCKESGGCFPGQSEVELEGGESKRMEEVRLGDRVLTMEDGRLATADVIGFLDKRINKTTSYLNLVLEDGGSLFVSRSHAIFIQGEDNERRDILAKDARVGDVVFVRDGQKTALARILEIRTQEKLGAYVPLTTSGTLLVDGVLVSCYTNAGHRLAHAAMAPLRWWPRLLLDDDLSQDTEGLRTFPGLMKELARKLGLLEQDGDRAAGGMEEAGVKPAGFATIGLASCEL